MLTSEWKSCVIDIDRATEFTGDDVDQYSEVANLGHNYEHVTVFVPTITSATITLYAQRSSLADGTNEIPYPIHFWHDNDADTNIAQATVAGTGGLYITFYIGGAQYIRVKSGANQAADRTFYLMGF